MPEVSVASGDGLDTCSAIVNGEMERVGAGAAIGVGVVVGESA